MTTAQKTAALVIRAWLEEGLETNRLRARIIRTADVSDPVALDTVAASEEEILAAVAEWLRSFTALR